MELDTLLGGLMQKFDDLGLKDRVNIIIASDHGMTDVSNANSIDLSQYIDFKNEVECLTRYARGNLFVLKLHLVKQSFYCNWFSFYLTTF